MHNTADSLVYQSERVLKDGGAKLEGPERDQLGASVNELKTARRVRTWRPSAPPLTG